MPAAAVRSPRVFVSIPAAIARIRAWRTAAGWTPHRYATLAAVPEATTRAIDEADWSPNLRTLHKLDALIPDGWQPGDPAPDAGQATNAAAE